jgi:hypothetical protein
LAPPGAAATSFGSGTFAASIAPVMLVPSWKATIALPLADAT